MTAVRVARPPLRTAGEAKADLANIVRKGNRPTTEASRGNWCRPTRGLVGERTVLEKAEERVEKQGAKKTKTKKGGMIKYINVACLKQPGFWRSQPVREEKNLRG